MLTKNHKTLKCITAIFIIAIISASLFSFFSIKTEATGIIDNGVYALENKHHSGYYLNIQSDSYKTGMHIQVRNYVSAPASESKRSGLYKISFKGSTNKYYIRTMRNNANTFERTSDNKVKTTSFSNSKYWIISDAGNGYYYLKDPDGYYLCAPSSTGDKYCTAELSSSERAKWYLHEYNGTGFSGVDIRYLKSHIMDMGSSTQFSASDFETEYFYSTDINTNTPGSITGYSVTSPGSNYTSNIAYMSNGFFTGVNSRPGMATVTVNFSTSTSSSFNIYFKPTFGEYFFLQNVQSTLGCVKSYGTYAKKTTFNYDDTQIWRRLNAGNGYYYIKNMDGKYLTAPSSSTTGANIGLESTLLTGSDLDRQKWKFVYTSSNSNSQKIQAASMDDLWLSISYNSSTSGNLIQHTYVEDSSYYDEFNVVMLGGDVVYQRTFEYASSVNISNIVKNLYDHYNSFELTYLQNHLGNNTTENDPDACHNIALDMLENSKVTVFAGHGSPSVITVSDYMIRRYLRNRHIYNGDIDLSDVDIVIFDGCSTAGIPDQGLLNMPDSAEVVGAKVAIGWDIDITMNHPAEWIDLFFTYMNTKKQNGLYYSAYEAWELTNDNIHNDSDHAKISGTNTSFSFN